MSSSRLRKHPHRCMMATTRSETEARAFGDHLATNAESVFQVRLSEHRGYMTFSCPPSGARAGTHAQRVHADLLEHAMQFLRERKGWDWIVFGYGDHGAHVIESGQA